MSSFINKFTICEKIPKTTKKMIKLIHIFDDYTGVYNYMQLNVIFVTHDDFVYGFGSNKSGALGLGHNMSVESPRIIPELCEQNIKSFIIGATFVVGQTCNDIILQWGHDNTRAFGPRNDAVFQ